MELATARLLVVEDNAIIAECIRLQLVKMKCEVVGVVDSGEEAVRLAEALQPDLTVMDITLNGSMDGFEAGCLIQQMLHSLVIYVTSDPRATQLPYSVEKPFTMAALASAVTKALASRPDPRQL